MLNIVVHKRFPVYLNSWFFMRKSKLYFKKYCGN